MYPLDLYFCKNCANVQLGHVVPPEIMFRNYLYVSGTTKTLTEYFHRLAREIVQSFSIPTGSLVVDIGSNDGTFLKGFKDLGMRVLGVDPAENIARIANAGGIETVPEFFTRETARQIAQERGRAKVITAAGVFYHIPDLDDVMEGVRDLLADDGIFMVQALYNLDMLQKNSFDNVYHEHVSYFSLKPLILLFRRFDMEVFEAKRASIHGGCIIVYVRKHVAFTPNRSVSSLVELEKVNGLHSVEAYEEFGSRVGRVREKLPAMLREMRTLGKRISAYGAPAKGNTMLNYCKIGRDLVQYAVEKNLLKVGMYTPGMHIPVISEEEARRDLPDYYLVLPWNFLHEFIQKESDFIKSGGRFIVPIPEPHIV
jgi:C-methyltransferase-like protein/methyltransferase family protein